MNDEKDPKIVLGAWAWGNDGTFGHGLAADELRPVLDAAMNAGLNLWDTAYVYGMGESERMLAGFLKDLPREDYRVSDKLTPQCMDASSKTAVADMYGMQLHTMGLDRFDVYWVHNTVDAPRWIGELAAYFDGREDAPVIGVSNHNLAEVKQADAILREHGLRLGAVQNHYSLINRSSEDSGILDWCHQNDVEFWSYMVLEQGALSGKYDTSHPCPRVPPAPRSTTRSSTGSRPSTPHSPRSRRRTAWGWRRFPSPGRSPRGRAPSWASRRSPT